jgi:hypothetical protein
MRNTTNFAGSKVILAFLETIGLSQAFQTLGQRMLYFLPTAFFTISSSVGCSDANDSIILNRRGKMHSSVMRLVVVYPITSF